MITHDRDAAQAVRQFSVIPAWLEAALDREQVKAALNRHVPEFASGALTLRDCAVNLLQLKNTDGEPGPPRSWRSTRRNWALVLADAAGERHIPVRVRLIEPGLAAMDQSVKALPLESCDWQCWLPELRLLVRHASSRAKDFPSLQALTDDARARPLLERALRTQAAGYEQVSIRSCTSKVLTNKPGKSVVIRYRLDYGPGTAGRGRLDQVILKAYGDDIGRRAFAGMRAAWNAGLHNSAAVRVPEPLAYLADQQATLQGPVPEDRDLERFFVGLLLSDDAADQRALHETFAATGAALAALHGCGAAVDLITTWSDTFALAADQIASLRAPFPEQIAAVERLVARLRALEAAEPVDPLVPTHGAFRPEQVLVAGKQVGIIDFDWFCMAEPAFDLALFRVTMLDNGLYFDGVRPRAPAEVATRLARIDALSESFLAAYEAHRPVSRERVALWEAIFYLCDGLQCWTKPRPDAARRIVPLLERHFHGLGIV